MLLVLEFDGGLFHWRGQAMSPDQLIRWLRWRQPECIELRREGRSCRLDWTRFLDLLKAEDPVIRAYRLLGLQPGAEVAAVKHAWRRLARQHHPDRGGTPQKMQELNAAYQLLARQATAVLSRAG